MGIGYELPVRLEASTVVQSNDKVYKIDLNDCEDTSEIISTADLQKSRCLHKNLNIGNKILLAGGSDLECIEVFDKDDIEKGSSTCTEQNKTLVDTLKKNLKMVSFNKYYLKKCSNT